MYDCFKLDLRIIMIGFREHVTQNVSDSTDVLGESGRLFIFYFCFCFSSNTPAFTTTWKRFFILQSSLNAYSLGFQAQF